MNTGNGTATTGSIRDARTSAGLTQQELADAAGCSVDYIRLLERGYAPRYSDVWPRIVAVLGSRASGLATRRQEMGLTQTQLANYCGLNEATITSLELGKELPDRTLAERLAAALQTSVDVIFPTNRSSPPARASSTKASDGGPDEQRS